jgi:aminomethyltransferase
MGPPRAGSSAEVAHLPDSAAESLKTTPLTQAHIALGARMVPFAGYTMPVQYPLGVMQEHLWTREHAGLFDVSHMGQAWVYDYAAFEKVVPGDYRNLRLGKQKYSVLLNETGGILDDLMAGYPDEQYTLFIVVNGACKENDFRIIERAVGSGQLTVLEDRALMAIQGPEAAAVVQAHVPAAADMVFMDIRSMPGFGTDIIISRSGYTGEDGYEISVPASEATRVWNLLLADERVKPIGLGARDSLRLEAGLPLYGHDLDETVSPVEAGLTFAINKNRREQRDFPGAARIVKELAEGPARVKVCLKVLEGAPAREGAEVADPNGVVVGVVTSGGYSPCLKAGIALAFVPPELKAVGTPLKVIVRGKAQPAEVVASPFVPHRYVRKG